MAFKSIQWSNSKKLDCACCLPANVFLCISAELIAQKDCPVQDSPEITGSTNFIFHTIEAVMTAFSPPANACEPCNYLYTFVYDDGQLVPDVTFAASNISGVLCEGCLTQWVQDTVGNDVKLERRDIEGVTYLVLTNQHGCEFAFLEGELPS